MKTLFILLWCLLCSVIYSQNSGEFNSFSGTALRASSGSGYGLYTTSLTNRAIYAVSGTSIAIKAESTDSYGVQGTSTKSYGLYGYSLESYGVYGASAASNSYGVYGTSTSGSGVRGLGGVYGVYGSSTSGYGLYGTSTNSNAIRGKSTNSGAIYGEAEGNGAGVIGYSAGGNGVVGSTGSESGFDFYAQSTNAGQNYGSASSGRWKTNIQNIPDPLQKMEQLRGVYFDWDQSHGGQHSIGFIAEEVGSVLPEIVAYEENGIDAIGMDYSRMTPLIVEAANAMRREYQDKFEKQEKRIKNLEQQLLELKIQINKFEKR